MTFPTFLISFPIPSIFLRSSKIFPDIIMDLMGDPIWPFFISKEFLASTEKSPEMGFAVWAPITELTITPSFVSAMISDEGCSIIRLRMPIDGVDVYDPRTALPVLSSFSFPAA